MLLLVADGQGGTATQSFSVAVQGDLACGLGNDGPRCNALAFAHTIRADSVPLGAVSVSELPPTGVSRMFLTDAESGLGLLGGQGPGTYRWIFGAPGFVPVTTSASLTVENVAWIGIPRLAPLTDLEASLTSAGGYSNDVDGRVSLTFAAGSVSASSTLHAAILDGQSLPAYPPRGWSPARAIYYVVDGATVTTGPNAHFVLPAPLPTGATIIVARFDEDQGVWMSMGAVTSTNATSAHPDIHATLGGEGGYAIFVGDVGAHAPPVPETDAEVEASTITQTASIAAAGRVVPEVQTLTVDSTAEDITGEARVWITSGVPSGALYPARLFEQYVFQDGRTADVPAIPLSVAFFAYPAAPDAPSSALSALFPVRPRHLMDPLDLPDVHQRIELRTAVDFEGSPLDEAGGVVSAGDLVLTIPAGALDDPGIIHLEPMDVANFTLEGATAIRALEIEWSISGLTTNARLGFDVGEVAPNANYVLARRELSDLRLVWQPVERFSSNSTGDLSTLESGSGGLPGITRAGTYVLFRVSGAQGVIEGVAKDSNAVPLSGVVLAAAGLPWGAITGADGAYALLGRVGTVRVSAELPASTDTGLATGTLTSASITLTLDVVVGPQAPFVVATSPIDGAVNTAVVSAIDIELSEPIAPSTIGAAVLTSTSGTVPTQRALRPGNRRLSLLPINPLEFNRTYTITLTGITDPGGLPLASPTSFTFTTAPATPRVGRSALLTSYAPGAQHTPCKPYDPEDEAADFDPTGVSVGVPGFDPADARITCVVGSAGVAEGDQPVVLVNEQSGVTVTVTARPNGSFKGFIRGAEDDLLSAVFINGNGTRTTIPLQMQKFDDGRVALYSSGGVLTAPNPFGGAEPFEFMLEAGAIARRGVFSFTPATPEETLGLVGEEPAEGTLIVGATIQYEGDPLQHSPDVRFPMTVAQLQLPSGTTPETAGFVLAQGQSVTLNGQAVTAYATVDRMRYEDGALATHSYPFDQWMNGERAYELNAAVIVFSGRPRPVKGYAVACAGPDTSACNGDPFTMRVNAASTNATIVTGEVPPRTVPARRLAGTFVTASSNFVGTSSITPPANVAQYQLRGGALIATTDRAGRYTLGVPLAADTVQRFVAFHPDYPYPAAGAIAAITGLTEVARLDLIFQSGASAAAPSGPSVVVTHSPESPQPFVGAGPPDASHRATVRVEARGFSSVPTGLTVTKFSAQALLNGEVVTVNDVTLTPVPSSTVTLGLTYSQLFYVTSPRAARVVLEATALENGQQGRSTHTIYFGLNTSAAPPNPTADPNDPTAPRLVRTSPANNAHGVATDEPLILTFSKPIHPSIVDRPGAFPVTNLSLPQEPPLFPASLRMRTSTELVLIVPGLQPATSYSLDVGATIEDLASRPYDGDPSTPTTREHTTMTFATAQRTTVTATTVAGALLSGATIYAGFAYVVDRGLVSGGGAMLPGAVRIYDISRSSDPLQPFLIHDVHLANGYPRSVRVIPNYSYARPRSAGPTPCSWGEVDANGRCEGRNRTLLAVIGGLTQTSGDDGGIGASANAGPYLAIIDITDPRSCATDPDCSFVIADQAATLSSGSSLGRLEWSPPLLSYLEFSGSETRINLADLQAFLYASKLTRLEQESLALTFQNGVDADGNGDYLGPNDQIPMPSGLPPFPGHLRSVGVTETTQEIRDFSVDGITRIVGVALGAGGVLNASNQVVGTATSSYRTLSSGTYFGTALPRHLADRPFSSSSTRTVDAVLVLGHVQLPVQVNALDPIDTESYRDLAIVGVSTSTTGGYEVRVYLLDITNPLNPTIVGQNNGILLPGVYPNRVAQIERDTLDPDRIRIFAADRNVTLALSRIGVTQPSNSFATHPAVVGVDLGLGGRGDIGIGDSGVRVEAAGSRLELSFNGPRFELVSFPQGSTLFHPQTFANASIPPSAATIRAALTDMRSTSELAVATIRDAQGLVEPSVAQHYYITMRAPGASGPTIDLLVEGLDESGVALSDLGRNFAPVRTITPAAFREQGLVARDGAATLLPLQAHQLSHDPNNPYFDFYVSDPVVMIYQSVSVSDLTTTLRVADDLPRHVLHSSAHVRASVDPSKKSGVLAPFASTIVAGKIFPGSAATFGSFAASRIIGPNPAPIAGPVAKAAGTLGLVSAHNREIAFGVTDLAAPTPGLPLAFQRSYVGQDEFEGPLGVGWDFNYNQRIVPVRPANLIGDDTLMLVKRDGTLDTEARGGDVLLHTGDGRVLLFTRTATGSRPMMYRTDPLITEKVGTFNAAADHRWYAPPPGVFDALVRFGESGTFLRVTPDGTLYRYDVAGRLTRIEDRFTNVQSLSYSLDGDLRTVTDFSTTTPHALWFGYYRDANDSARDATLDINAAANRPNARGKLARVKDDAGREVLFTYDENNQLVGVSGVDTERKIIATTVGRQTLSYHWSAGRLASLGGMSINGDDYVSAVVGADGQVASVDLPRDSSAARARVTVSRSQNKAISVASVHTLVSSVDGTTEYTLDAKALPHVVKVTGGGSGPVERTQMDFDDQYRLRTSINPRGKIVTTTPDFGNANLRSRANLMTEVHTPGTAGVGDVLIAQWTHYDPSYNLPDDDVQGLDGRTQSMTLSGDGTYIAAISFGGLASRTFVRTPRGQLTSTIREDGTTSTIVYDDSTGFPILLRDGTRTTTLAYGCARGRATGQPCTVSPPDGAEITLDYTESGALAFERRGTFQRDIAYNINGLPAREEVQTGNEPPRIALRTYSQLGVALSYTEQKIEIDSPTALASATWTTRVDAMGRVHQTETPLGVVVNYTHERGRVKTIVGGGHNVELTYDAGGNLVQQSDSGALEKWTPDGHDRVREHTNVLGGMTTYSFVGTDVRLIRSESADHSEIALRELGEPDNAGRITSVAENGSVWTIDPHPGRSKATSSSLGLAVETKWDPAGRTKETSADSGAIHRGSVLDYSDAQRKTAITSALGDDAAATLGRQWSFDSLGYVESSADGQGAVEASYAHRSDGVLTSWTQAPGSSAAVPMSLPATRLGESLGRISASGVKLENDYDADRRVIREGRPGRNSARRYGYDVTTGLLNRIDEPDSTSWTFGNLDPRGYPRAIGMPGGTSMTVSYNAIGQPETQSVSFGGFAVAVNYAYDGAGRPTSASDSGSSVRITRREPNGTTWATLTSTSGPTREWRQDNDPDGRPLLTTYPTGNVVVEDQRDAFGQLRSQLNRGDGTALIQQVTYGRAGMPSRIMLGNGVTRTDEHDHRGRLKSRRYADASDATLSEQIYTFDAANREVQRVHENGLMHRFSYDADNRLVGADIDVRPSNAPGEPVTGGYSRTFAYTSSNSDALTTITTTGAAPAFASQLGNHDAFGHAGSMVVNGATHTRTRDALGHTTQTWVETGTATLSYDGLGRLRRAQLGNGTRIHYAYRADGALRMRTVACGPSVSGCESGIRTYVYAGLQLLEEYSQPTLSDTPELRARYFYEDGSDIPLAADLVATSGGAQERVYYVTDRMGNVIGALDDQGVWLERVSYDAYGQPEFEQSDVLAPEISSITMPPGKVRIAFTEPVAPKTKRPSPSSDDVTAPADDAIAVKDASGAKVPVHWAFKNYASGAPTGTTLELTPATVPGDGTTWTLVVHANRLKDRWSNAVATTTIAITWGGGGFTGTAPGTTQGGVAKQSYVGSHLSFQSHLWDAEAGLILARARVLDPMTGLFLQRDPSGFVDSVNVYAAMANDPINNRDPTGRETVDGKYCEWWVAESHGSASGPKTANCADLYVGKAIGAVWAATLGRSEKVQTGVAAVAEAAEVQSDRLAYSYEDATRAVQAPGQKYYLPAPEAGRKGVQATQAGAAGGMAVYAFTRYLGTILDDVAAAPWAAQAATKRPYALFNKTHAGALPIPRGVGPSGGRLQSHHGLQRAWADANLGRYGYDSELAPSITLETGEGLPHSIVSARQNARRDARLAAGKPKWGSSLQDELESTLSDLREAGLTPDQVEQALEQQYSMLRKLGVPFTKVGSR